MDNDTKLMIFLETLGDGVDIDVAKSVLEMHGWDLEAAIMTMTGAGDSSPARQSARPPVAPGDDEVRAPMAGGYHDTLVAPPNPVEEAAFERQRQEEERERKRQADAQKAVEDERRNQSNEQQAGLDRKTTEEEVQLRRNQKRSDELAEKRLKADPVKWQAELDRRQAEADAAAERQQNDEERQRREAAKAEAEAKKTSGRGRLAGQAP